jgi:quinol monooxygenase YgiN
LYNPEQSMIEVLNQIRVGDFEVWRKNYEAPEADAQRKRHGVLRATIYQDAQDAQKVVVLTQFESLTHMQDFMKDPDVQETMKRGGNLGPPSMQVVEQKLTRAY